MLLLTVLLGAAILASLRAVDVALSATAPLGRASVSASPQSDGAAESAAATSDPQDAQAERTAAEREIDHYFRISLISLGLSLAGSFVDPLFYVLSVSLTLYCSLPVFQRALRTLFIDRRLKASITDSIAVSTTLIAGYYTASALTSAMYYFSRKLLLKTEDQSRKKLVNIFGAQPRTIRVYKNGAEVELPFEELAVGDTVLISGGQPVPVDGTVCEGSASIDQHMLTGEAQPVEKAVGDSVFAATLVLAGRIAITVTKTGVATVAAQIGTILNQTADYRSLMDSRGERLADQAVLPMLSLGALAYATVGSEAALAILYSDFADSMRVAAPLSMLNFLDTGAKHGVLIKDGRALELLHAVDVVVFDKTGTLTIEQPHVGAVHPCSGFDAQTVIRYAAAAESRQSHPIARAICEHAAQQGLSLPTLESARYQLGYGIEAQLGEHRVFVGSARFMRLIELPIPEPLARVESEAHERGQSLVYVAIDGQLGGALELHPTLRSEVPEVLGALKARGLSLYIISGDHEAPTRRLARQLGIDAYFAEVLPEAKAGLVKQLQEKGHRVCFIGDGINDAIALKTANASVSLSGATSIATDTAQIVMLDGSLRQLPFIFEMASRFQSNMRTSLIASAVPSAICITGAFFLGFGVFSAILFYNLGLIGSVANAMLPRLRPVKVKPRTPAP